MNQAQQLLAQAFAGELDLDADASGSSVVAGESPSTPAAQATTTEAAMTTVEAPAQDEQEGAPIASKSGSYTIPYEKLTEARTARDSAIAEAAQLRAQLEQLTATQAANVLQAQGEAQTRADAGQAPTQADQNLATAQAMVAGGADASMFGDFSEEALAKGIEKLVSARVEAALAPQREAQARDLIAQQAAQAQTAEQAHAQAIMGVHKDAFEVAESKEFAAWKAGQPGFMQAAIDRTLTAGTAQDVIDLLGQFKQVHAGAAGAASGDPTAAAVAKAMADAKSAPPVSLSSLPGAAPAGTTEADRAVELANNPAALLEYMSSLPPDRQTRLMNSVV